MVAGVPYDSSVDRTHGGATSVIKDGSVKLRILADALEAGKCMDEATVLVNEHRRDDGSEPVGAVLSIRVHFPWIQLYLRLNNTAKETEMETVSTGRLATIMYDICWCNSDTHQLMTRIFQTHFQIS
jgi:hypothetical protein